MKIGLYDDYKVGLLKDGNVVDVSRVVPRGGTPQLTIEGLIANFQSLKGTLERALDQGEGIPLSSVQLRAPVPRPGKIVCMGGNFREFVGRKGTMWGFLKSPEAVLDPGGTVVLPPESAVTGAATEPGQVTLPVHGARGGCRAVAIRRGLRPAPRGRCERRVEAREVWRHYSW